MTELNDNNFKQEIQNRKLVLVDFYATWCGPCSMQAKVLDNLQTSRRLGVDIVKVNVDEAPRVAMEYGIESIPTLVLFRDNKVIKRIVGYTEQNELLKKIDEVKE